ncbi:HD domain-containing protein [archaeon]|nr:HD domain-containing protein [archaeon]
MTKDLPCILAGFLSLFEGRDAYTVAHSDQVAHISIDLAIALGLRQNEIDCLRVAGLCHDFGKIAWSDVALKSSRVISSAVKVEHPRLSFKLIESFLQSSETIDCLVAVPVLYHHWDYTDTGGRYPVIKQPWSAGHLKNVRGFSRKSLFGTKPQRCTIDPDIPRLLIGIIRVADSFSAAVSLRKYNKKTPKPPEVVVGEIIASRSRAYHPNAVDALVGIWQDKSWLAAAPLVA